MNWKKISFYAAGVAGVALIAFGGYVLYKKFFTDEQKTEFILQKAARMDLELTIAATGTVEPEELVNVGAQVGGMITTLGTDANGNTVNYGSEVKAGTVLARIDDALYQTEKQSAEAQLKQAQAQLKQAEAQQKQAQTQKKTGGSPAETGGGAEKERRSGDPSGEGESFRNTRQSEKSGCFLEEDGTCLGTGKESASGQCVHCQ